MIRAFNFKRYKLSQIDDNNETGNLFEDETSAEAPVEDYKQRLEKLESMIVPFLEKLKETGDKEYIYWPNRKPKIEKQIQAILKLTRG